MGMNYIDITEEMLKNATPYIHDIKELIYFTDKNGVKHYVDGKNVVLDYSFKEKAIALFIVKTFGGEIFLLPRVNYPEGINSADYLWNGEYWDLKTINGCGKRCIEDTVKDKQKQANNFIFDITNSSLNQKEIFIQLDKLYYSSKTYFVEKVLVIKNNKIICFFKRI